MLVGTIRNAPSVQVALKHLPASHGTFGKPEAGILVSIYSTAGTWLHGLNTPAYVGHGVDTLVIMPISLMLKCC